MSDSIKHECAVALLRLRRNAAHYENTILITDGDPELLTDASASLV